MGLIGCTDPPPFMELGGSGHSTIKVGHSTIKSELILYITRENCVTIRLLAVYPLTNIFDLKILLFRI